MITTTGDTFERKVAIQFYNDLNGPNLVPMLELLDQLDEDIEDFLDLVVEQAIQPDESGPSQKQMVFTWSHFLRATHQARSHVNIPMVALPWPRFAQWDRGH